MGGSGVKVSKVLFNNPDWSIVRHSVTGVVMHREINATLITKKSATDCEYQERLFAEDYLGERFTNKLRLNGVGLGNGPVLWANVP